MVRDVLQGKRTETVCIPRRIELRLEWNGLEDIHDQNEGKVLHPAETAASGLKRTIHWNLDLTKCQETREIGSLYRGSLPYILN